MRASEEPRLSWGTGAESRAELEAMANGAPRSQANNYEIQWVVGIDGCLKNFFFYPYT